MCGMYWTLDTEITCPGCQTTGLWNLQTHFMGGPGSYEHRYRLGDRIPELRGVTVLLDGRIDDFNGDCEACGRFFDVGAEIVAGRVERVFIIRAWELQATPVGDPQ
jgi:hypothetical protein